MSAEDDRLSEIARNAVARKLRGLPFEPDAPQVYDGEFCVERCGRKRAAKGSQAHAQGLCVECATFMRRHGDWHTPPLDS